MNEIQIFPDYRLLSQHVASRIAQIVREKPTAVLGLATGSTPLGVYHELIRLHREENLDFSGVACFNLDEYFPMQPDAPQSYHRFMSEQLFDHINCQNWHVPAGHSRSLNEIEADCAAYEQAILNAGGLDFQLLGIGRTGHIGFNEPGSAPNSRTRLVVLDKMTRSDAANDFFGLQNVPIRAITMGISTIFDAREIAIMASGTNKSAVVAAAIEGPITSKVPASFLREHPHAKWYFDRAAAAKLTRIARPWSVSGTDSAQADLRRRAMLSAALERNKPLSQLNPDDLESCGASNLFPSAQEFETAKNAVETDLRKRLNDDILPENRTILCLSPHPDDDVICCGATLLKMTARGNRVVVAYGVNGANAVRDKDVLALLRARQSRLISFLETHLQANQTVEQAIHDVRAHIFEREDGQSDPPLLRELKRLVREGEASDACRKMGAEPMFLNLPFYGNGVHRLPIGDEDVARFLSVLETVQPDLVLLTGEKNDPHGTHKKCEEAFDLAAQRCLVAGGKPFGRWNYRGAWDDYETEEGDYFSVFDKAMMQRKIDLILDHISQLDPLFPGEQPQEFWERARDRNRENARQLQRLGLLPSSRSFAPIYAEVFKCFSD